MDAAWFICRSSGHSPSPYINSFPRDPHIERHAHCSLPIGSQRWANKLPFWNDLERDHVIDILSPWCLYFQKQCTQGLITSIKTHLALLGKKKYQHRRDPSTTMCLLRGPKYPAWFFCAFSLAFGKQLAVGKWVWAMGFQSWCCCSPVCVPLAECFVPSEHLPSPSAQERDWCPDL